MKNGKGPVNENVHPSYLVETYLKSYGGSIKPMAGPNEWPSSDKEPPLPPLYTAKPRRPKKLRKRGCDEVSKKGGDEVSKDGIHLRRSFVKMHCTKCKKEGNNKRKCPDNLAVRERLANTKKRVKTTSNIAPQLVTVDPLAVGADPLLVAVHPLQLGADPLPVAADPLLNDDSWLASIDIDAMVSQLLQTPPSYPHVNVDEIAIISQPPTIGEEEEELNQDQAINKVEVNLEKKNEGEKPIQVAASRRKLVPLKSKR
ncbi:uncharacterized protein LOC116019532 isoform X1 [Ipomoea triloba]|uniref:uncharacterized protein LOC116019532 isoform X1 n=1 Tax=Ipomoea triloba TaxID=35885 RepID=UPI00125D1A0D|nr:uncharacterized protein LOC116019532 isoform X1 [Ipomoea triloba]